MACSDIYVVAQLNVWYPVAGRRHVGTSLGLAQLDGEHYY